MTRTHLISEEKWYGCYGPRGELFLPESNAHPAKMAVGLCYRIFEHGRERGYWQPRDVVLDPMAGIFTTGIVGASLGYRCIGVELERHFLALARKNMDSAIARLRSAPTPVLLGGDARRLAAILEENYWYLDGWQQGLDANAAVTSPPYADQDLTGARQFRNRHQPDRPDARSNAHEGYAAAVSSPPYADAQLSMGADFRVRALAREGKWSEAIALFQEYERDHVARGLRRSVRSDEAARTAIQRALEAESYSLSGAPLDAAQIGNLRDPKGDIDAVLSSPPYTDVLPCDDPKYMTKADGSIRFRGNSYGHDPKNIGNEKTIETYLSAMLKVYQQLHAVLRPGGYVCLVTKNPVKAGKLRRLDEDTIRLMQAAGFELVERCYAMLSEELGVAQGLPGIAEDKVVRRERKSFFKRLYEKNHPELRVDHEDVLFFRRRS